MAVAVADAVADAVPEVDAAAVPEAGPEIDTTVEVDAGCSSAAQCPQPADPACQVATCTSGACGLAPKADGSACGTSLCQTAVCLAGKCALQNQKVCDDGQPCTTDACNPATGACTYAVATEGAACDDGNDCTVATTCKAGKCSGGNNACGCKTIKDCAAFDDGNACNGTLYCDTTSGACLVLPSSVVICDPSADGPCTVATCDPKGGACNPANLADGTTCDDSNPCTIGEKCAAGACKAQANVCQCQSSADCATAEDGNLCNGTLYCDKTSAPYVCKVNPATLVQCAKAAGPCQLSACEAKTGKCAAAKLADNSPCDDGNAKTVGDACIGGQCVAGVDLSLCKTDGDCAGQEDGNFCNGTLFCNKATGQCQLNPKTVVSCPSVDNTACQKNQCQPKSGVCQLTAINGGGGCEDGDPCTTGEVCASGTCTPSAAICQCATDADCLPQDDGDKCNGTLYCDKQVGTCKLNPATVVSCPSVGDSPCSKNLCNKKTGVCAMTAVFEAKPCDDGNGCTSGDVCTSGQCTGTTTCQCMQDSDCAAQEDGDLCNGTLYCEKVSGQCKVNPATIKKCATAGDTACLKTACEPKTGQCVKSAVWNGAQCDADGSPCTAYDYCDDGACKAGKNICQCQKDADCAGAAKGDLCVVQMACDPALHKCVAIQTVQCPASDAGPCSPNACVPATGKCAVKALEDGTLCGNSKLCAAAKVCQAGACVAGKALSCDDTLACIADSCDDKSGCVHTATSGEPCDDSNTCTAGDSCNSGACLGTSKDCSDSSPCTDDACDPKVGCTHLPNAATSCDDGNFCTIGDVCKNGACQPGASGPDCDDALPCTTDSCAPTQGCVHKGVTGAKCSDGDLCTANDACSSGQCVGTTIGCDDANGCTKDACDASSGCTHSGATGQACTDGNACTGPDACTKAGMCQGDQVQCDDKNPCTLDTCNIGGGCLSLALSGVECNDGDSCTAPDTCQGAGCKGKPLTCSDDNPCTADSCVGGNCSNAAVAGLCSDASPCTVDDTCTNGKCVGKPFICDDANACTVELCVSGSCLYGNTPNGAPCSVGDSCQISSCTAGTCLGTPQLWQVSMLNFTATGIIASGSGFAVCGAISIKPWMGYLTIGGKLTGSTLPNNNGLPVSGIVNLGGDVILAALGVTGTSPHGVLAVTTDPLAVPVTKNSLTVDADGVTLPVIKLYGITKSGVDKGWAYGMAMDGTVPRGILLKADAKLNVLATAAAPKATVQYFETAVELANGDVLAMGRSTATSGLYRYWRVLFGFDGTIKYALELASSTVATPTASARMDDYTWTALGNVVTAWDPALQALWSKIPNAATAPLALVPMPGNRVYAMSANAYLRLMRADGRTEFPRPIPSSTVPYWARATDGTLAMAKGDTIARFDGFGWSQCGPCLGETAAMCNDGDPCTYDDCNVLAGCQHLPVSCADGNPCPVQGCPGN